MFNKKTEPVRLERQEPTSVRKILSRKRTFQIANWVIISILLLLFVGLCFFITKPTYGFFWY